MNEDEKRKFELPWGTLLPVIAALAGIVAQYKPLVSTRPAAPSEKPIQVTAEQDVDARLWQDPIAVAQKQKAALTADILAGRVPRTRAEQHDISSLVELLHKRATTIRGRVLLLGVMIDAGPYSEQAELRLRARQAVLEGLSESGFVPMDGEHIGYVTTPWPIETERPVGVAESIENAALLLPWEECEAMDDPARVFPPGTARVVVLWLPSANFSPDPLGRFAELVGILAKDSRDKIDVKLIGPANSTGLQSMIREARGEPLSDPNQDALDGVSIISPRATASDAMLLYDPSPPPFEIRLPNSEISLVEKTNGAEETVFSEWAIFANGSQALTKSLPPLKLGTITLTLECVPIEKTFHEFLSLPASMSVQVVIEGSVTPRRRGGLHFLRTIATDDVVLRELIRELARRKISVKHRKKDGGGVNHDHVVILSEWDTPYGRSLNTTFAAEASRRSVNEIIEERDKLVLNSDKTVVRHPESEAIEEEDIRLRRIHSYRYLRGIDGQLPGDPARENPHEQSQKNQLGQETVAVEATEGLNQSDYLRRLARELKEKNTRWQQRDGTGIRAIGLLGSDLYDKLMILRALRPEFPEALFFTNNYDAHFERRDDLDDTRNLIIGSPFGGALPENYTRQHIAPFRDNNQTSMYAGTLVATEKMEETVAAYLSWQPRIFEISRRGAYDLSPEWYIEGKNLSQSNKTWFWDWLDSDHVELKLLLGAIFLALMVAWVSMSIANRALPGGGTTWRRLKRVVSSTAFWLVCGTPVIVFSVTAFAQSDCAAQEPLAFFSGISIWPSEMLRLIAFMLAIHFMIKAGIDLRANARELEERFCLEPLPPTRFCWRDLGLGFDLWRPRAKEGEPEPEFSAQEAWHAYLRRNKFWPRFIRIGVLFTTYLVFSFSVFTLFPRPFIPARGEAAFHFDFAMLLLAAVGMMILSFYVVDAIQLNSNFIRMFAREVTKWGRGVAERCHRSPPLSEEELSAYHEIFFVAQRTQVIARLIWYPLIVLTLMVVARSSFFDRWTWPLSLVLIYALNATWALGSAILLRRAAEQLRDAAISNLQLLRVMSHAVEVKRAMFDELIDEIRGLRKGAFAPLTEQPFIRAIIFPSGGLGLLAVGQRLLDIF